MNSYNKISKYLKHAGKEERFRASLYVDIFVPAIKYDDEGEFERYLTPDELNAEAKKYADEFRNQIEDTIVEGQRIYSNPYIGGVTSFSSGLNEI